VAFLEETSRSPKRVAELIENKPLFWATIDICEGIINVARKKYPAYGAKLDKVGPQVDARAIAHQLSGRAGMGTIC